MQKWRFYTAKEIKPRGWMKKQLQIQAAGQNGNLDKIWRDVRDSSWIGGDAEGWERVPYWLDGFIPLAFLLRDEDMIARAKKYIDAILSFQREDGWICPCREEQIATYDTWAVQLISKVLVVWFECSGDERIPGVLYRVMKNYYDLLASGKIGLFEWGKSRWFEGFVALRFLAERYDENWIEELGKILKEQGIDYPSLVDRWRKPVNTWTHETHIVNMGMMLKYEAISSDLLGEELKGMGEKLYRVLDAYHGRPVGIFTGDECLAGLSPIQGSELCSVVELMYSYEWLYAVTGDAIWAERLEKAAFNALPATLSDDMWVHQYDQMTNQIACVRFTNWPIFRTNGSEAHLFGLEPGYGCCTADHGQGWPKLALSAFMHDGDTIHSALPIPSEVDCEEGHVVLDTAYPFENRFVYTVKAKKDMELCVRIPSFAKDLVVDGEKRLFAPMLSFAVAAGEERRIVISFDVETVMEQRPGDLRCVRRGSLVYALPIKYESRMLEFVRNGVERKFPYCDYELRPASDWNFAFASLDFVPETRGVGDMPFSSTQPPVVLKTKMRKIAWGLAEGYEWVCAKTPQSLEPVAEQEEIELWPYGCTMLRMTEMPLI